MLLLPCIILYEADDEEDYESPILNGIPDPNFPCPALPRPKSRRTFSIRRKETLFFVTGIRVGMMQIKPNCGMLTANHFLKVTSAG